MNKLKKMKENIKGFTLVEIIVVLLILAIMAAIAIPSMLGYVQEARNSEYIAEARTGFVAAQTVVTKKASAVKPLTDAELAAYIVDAKNIKEITDYIGADENIDSITAATVVKGRITSITVKLSANKGSKSVNFAGGESKLVE